MESYLRDIILRTLPYLDAALAAEGDSASDDLIQLQHSAAVAAYEGCPNRGQGCDIVAKEGGYFTPSYLDHCNTCSRDKVPEYRPALERESKEVFYEDKTALICLSLESIIMELLKAGCQIRFAASFPDVNKYFVSTLLADGVLHEAEGDTLTDAFRNLEEGRIKKRENCDQFPSAPL